MKNKNKLNGTESLAKTNNNLIKQISEHLFEVRKEVREDNRIKYRLLWSKYDSVLLRCLKVTDMFCMQVADNKILRAKNEYLLKELRNYVPELHMFQENNKTEEVDESEDSEEDSKQLEFDFGNIDNIDDHRKH